MTQHRACSKEAVQQRVDDILNRTRDLFLELNYYDITLASIAKELKISRPSIYNYFTSKEELFLSLLKQEYINCEIKLRIKFTKALPIEIFCQSFIQIFYQQNLFIKLLSLHTSVLEKNVVIIICHSLKKIHYHFF